MQHRVALRPDNPLSGLSSKAGVATASVFALILLAAAVFVGTVSLPLSKVFFPHKVFVGAGFYNGVLIPLACRCWRRWLRHRCCPGPPPETRQVKALLLAVGAGVTASVLAWLNGLRPPGR